MSGHIQAKSILTRMQCRSLLCVLNSGRRPNLVITIEHNAKQRNVGEDSFRNVNQQQHSVGENDRTCFQNRPTSKLTKADSANVNINGNDTVDLINYVTANWTVVCFGIFAIGKKKNKLEKHM